MTDENQIPKQTVDAIIKGVALKTALLVSIAAGGVLIFSIFQETGQRWWFLPASVLFGGVLGLLNFRWLAIAVERVYVRKGAVPAVSNIAASLINMLKLSLIFIILFIVIKWQVLHVFGLVGGLSLCFLAIIWEGATLMKHTLKNSEK
ncbi:MAG TPA: ATP synthase subunit I [Nitrospirota bacterium]|nr:ATP synthase subunit I [Nitrospirota bacterium]